MSGLTKRNMDMIRKELEKLGSKGILTPEQVIEKARNPKSALHSQFDWDDSTAAHSHRIQQARVLIKRVRVEIVRADQTVIQAPVFVRAEGKGYALTQQVAVSTVSRQNVVLITLGQCRTMLANLAAPEVDAVIAAIDAAVAAVREQQAA